MPYIGVNIPIPAQDVPMDVWHDVQTAGRHRFTVAMMWLGIVATVLLLLGVAGCTVGASFLAGRATARSSAPAGSTSSASRLDIHVQHDSPPPVTQSTAPGRRPTPDELAELALLRERNK
ncbi:MAG: hypothetical protein UW43_C0007G0002 [Candidatus Yanofskybacteria bacterium GW2011_GWA1_44_21]|uniref:Uncharacterized protein n=2 Tax=Candidatus Yanofskyibacteriota TaxID=1752733 RepID=A0A1F8GZS7_9BACT|nr:MAG: hypothetical protein UW14_C0007G0034 [Candidatus Yanofskybacteria bacterium GW2011_GWA2_44_10]KKT50385.1 MAG: hypothetical protein UW43_C0007G0002 [Candidatus Yanofskybacteria bacterium GW2011_GWA1_44_21]KKT89978.1 MAG: hypothetical protein UW90_C0009G0002 [Candidatus Yanofskybacteria bacterium GW2011_GWB1_45_11]OGN03366.1 MAG: hypothetical protein A2657_00010 [Candidatus Yanofskybacteria bacterium RIFCSPHIGHO2_01_FULL_44_110b]OGN14713.1 MAG: hypothetical protein A3C01_02110 [Candidatus